MSRFRTGLVVGKFAPLHLGHECLIRAAFAACEQVIILSYARPELPGYEPERRAAWLAARFPEATRIVLGEADEALPLNSASDDTHRAFTAEVLRRRDGCVVDAIFSSEDYGTGFAADLERRQGRSVAHILVDAARSQVPISGSVLRADLHANRRFLAAEVYASFVERIALLGGESTGKSTLAIDLAREFGTRHVAEYGRERWEQCGGALVFSDLAEIAREQIKREEAALRAPGVHRYMFCDTTPLTTLFYSLDLFGRAEDSLVKMAQRSYARTVLCAADFPFVQDGTRRDESFRAGQQAWYRSRLAEQPYLFLTGARNERIRCVGRWLAEGSVRTDCPA